MKVTLELTPAQIHRLRWVGRGSVQRGIDFLLDNTVIQNPDGAFEVGIPTDLITISEAASLIGMTVQAVSLTVDKGQLASYPNPDPPNENPTHARRLVSKADVLARWHGNKANKETDNARRD